MPDVGPVVCATARPWLMAAAVVSMRRRAVWAFAVLLTAQSAAACDAVRDQETRYYSTPSKPEARRGSVLSAFKRAHPCPASGARAGPCPGWILDHVIPLACGGGDAVLNLQWLPTAIWREKSRWERKIYRRRGDAPTAYCG